MVICCPDRILTLDTRKQILHKARHHNSSLLLRWRHRRDSIRPSRLRRVRPKKGLFCENESFPQLLGKKSLLSGVHNDQNGLCFAETERPSKSAQRRAWVCPTVVEARVLASRFSRTLTETTTTTLWQNKPKAKSKDLWITATLKHVNQAISLILLHHNFLLCFEFYITSIVHHVIRHSRMFQR